MITVIGDIMLDRSIVGTADRIAPEAPTPIVKQQKCSENLGGAGNVARNIAALGSDVTLIGVIGRDQEGVRIKQLAADCKGLTLIANDWNGPTTMKTRLYSNAGHQLARYDREKKTPCGLLVTEEIGKSDVVVISDYDKGCIDAHMARFITKECQANGVKLLVDTKSGRWDLYNGAWLAKPNRNAVETDNIEDAVQKLLKSGFDNVLLTLDAEGMLLEGKDGHLRLASRCRRLLCASGAGDTVIASLAVSLSRGLPLTEATEVANIAASIAVSRPDISIISEMDLFREMNTSKLYSYDEASQLVDMYRQNSTIVFTNGIFDVLHNGHISLLRQAATMGDLLIVGLNSDSSVVRSKGPHRPYYNQNERIEMLSALEMVDAIVIFDQDTPQELIEKIQPNILVKGSDWRDKTIAGQDIVDRVEFVDIYGRYSSTNIISRLRQHNDSAREDL